MAASATLEAERREIHLIRDGRYLGAFEAELRPAGDGWIALAGDGLTDEARPNYLARPEEIHGTLEAARQALRAR